MVDLVTLTKIFLDQQRNNISDLHLVCDQRPFYRVDGLLKTTEDLPILSSKDVLAILEPYMSKRAKEKLDKKGQADFAVMLSDELRFRANLYKTSNGVCCALRNIPNKIPDMQDLNLPRVMYDILNRRDGLILITGPTGSGKSTSMASMINYMNKKFPMHILTIEDPIEYTFKNELAVINQREIGSSSSSFDEALRAALREDVDAIVVGEMRDPETIKLALTAAETGHLVIGTLHTASAAETIDRIVDTFPGDEKDMIAKTLSATLKATIAQRLLKRRSGGRVAVFELMCSNSAIVNLIRKRDTHQIPSVIQTSSKSGMCTMEDYAKQLLSSNVIDQATFEDFLAKYGDMNQQLKKSNQGM